MTTWEELAERIRTCRLCADQLEHEVRPIFQGSPKARVLIAGQAPGRVAHASGIPFDDVSGDRLRDWMGIDRQTFYDPEAIAIVPMGFCFPGTGKSGDLPPRPECAPAWRSTVLDRLPQIDLTLVIGRYAIDWHLDVGKESLASVVARRGDFGEEIFPLPHPSPRNRLWMTKNPWFASEALPELARAVATALS